MNFHKKNTCFKKISRGFWPHFPLKLKIKTLLGFCPLLHSETWELLTCAFLTPALVEAPKSRFVFVFCFHLAQGIVGESSLKWAADSEGSVWVMLTCRSSSHRGYGILPAPQPPALRKNQPSGHLDFRPPAS